MNMTRRILALVALMALLLGGAATADAWGQRGAGWGRPGVYFGPGYWGPRPWWGPGWYGFRPWPYYPYYGGYYYPYGGAYAGPYAPPVIVQQDPQVYIQQTPPAQVAPTSPSQPQPSQYWYYCEDARGYYPYVQQCPKGWMTVIPPASTR
jgi:hypothetical protein